MTGVWFGDLSLSAHLFLFSERITPNNTIRKTTNYTFYTNNYTGRIPMERITLMNISGKRP